MPIKEEELKHIVITLAQANALKRIFDRDFIYPNIETGLPSNRPFHDDQKPMTFYEFIQSVSMSGEVIMVPWFGMWLGIEPDGYTHS